MVLLAGPGVLISTFCIGSLLKLTFPYNWDWKTSLLLGGLLGATDPVAVVALLKELGASKKLTTMIDGESLMNDGGVIIAEGVLSGQKISYEGNSWGFLFLLYLYVQLSRCVVVGVLYPLLRRFGYGLDWKESIILTWSGLRGAVSLSLALSVKQSSGSSYLSSETGTRFLFFTGGIVFLTLVVNGSTTQLLLHLLGMDSLAAAKKRILEYRKCEMLNTALKAFENLGDDEELGSADWHTVITHISSLKDLERGQVNPHNGYEAGNLDPTNITDIRIRFLNGVQVAYWEMLDDGRITQSTASVLMQSVDLVSTEALCDWRGLKPCVRFPNYCKFLQSRIIPRKLVTYLIVERLESACYISSAFLRAHRIARLQLHDFLGTSDIASTVFNESEVEGEEAKQFLEDVCDSFPQVLSVLKTRQVTHYVLNHLNGYIKNLEKVGLLEGKEVSHLHDVVQSDLKKLLRNPPLLKLPNVNDLIATNPLLRAL
uniref:Sodium/hydrogen exchanger 8 n=2 Tax=Noccaea caerulescens TaxID=107243 RepID=A0A1J3K0S5_NOCCA